MILSTYSGLHYRRVKNHDRRKKIVVETCRSTEKEVMPLTKSTIVEVTEASVKKTSPLVTMKLALMEACVKTTFPLVTMKLTL